MKKKTLSLALALVMCFGLTVPAFAAVPVSGAGSAKNITISLGLDVLSQEDLTVKDPWVLYDIDAETGTPQTGYTAIKKDTVITVTHSGTEDDDSTLRVSLVPYTEIGAMGEQFPNQTVRGAINGTYALTADGWQSARDLSSCAELKAGESKSFTIPFENEEMALWGASDEPTYPDIFQLTVTMRAPQSDSDSVSSLFVKENATVCDAAIAKAAATANTPAQPEQPQQPAAETIASPTNDKLEVNGAAADPTVYKIGGSNYFKIRDVAALLNGTEKQFAVGYDGALNSVTAATGEGYEKQSGDLAGAAAGGDQTAAVSNDTIYVDGRKVEAEVYKINGSNYFKLRDLGKALNFYVGWTAERGMYIETSKPYSE